MRINGISINSFAGLHGISLSPKDGVNIIKGKNESGKSRICAFIRFMLYGLQKKEDINRVLSFGESSCSGTMTVGTAEGRYRIEREAAFAERGGKLSCTRNRCRITDLASGEEIATDKTPGELFFGVPAQVYSSTAYINQIDGSRTGDSELSEAAANIIFSADENMSAAKALGVLDEVRIALYHKDRRGGRIAEETAKIEALKAQLVAMEKQSQEIVALSGMCEKYRVKQQKEEKMLAELNAYFDAYDRRQIKLEYEEYKNAISERDALKRRGEQAKSDISKDGFFPDAAYVSELRKSGAKAEQAMISAFQAQEEEKNAAAAKRQLSDRASFFEKLNAHGGYARVKDGHDRLEKKKKTAVTAAVLLSVAAAACALLAVLAVFGVIPFIPAVRYALFGGAGAFAAAAVISGIAASKASKATAAMSALFGTDVNGFTMLLSAIEGNESATAAVIEREKAATAARERAEVAYISALSETKAVLSRAFDTDDIPDDELLSYASNAVEVIEKAHGEIAAISSRCEAKNEYAAGLLEKLGHYTEEEIAAACGESFDDEEFSKANVQEKKRKRDFLIMSKKESLDLFNANEKKLSVLLATTTPAADIESEIDRISEQLEKDKRDFEAVTMAMDAIKQSEAELKSSISPRIAAKASSIMTSLSDNKYDTLSVSQNFGLSYLDGGMTRDISYLSAGTSDIAYLALRIALVDTLFSGEKPPLIFDESFSRLDRDRLSALNALTAKLAGEGTQCILFCCDDRLAGFEGEKIELG